MTTSVVLFSVFYFTFMNVVYIRFIPQVRIVNMRQLTLQYCARFSILWHQCKYGMTCDILIIVTEIYHTVLSL